MNGSRGSRAPGARQGRWRAALTRWKIVDERCTPIVTEGALLGAVLEHGVSPELAVVKLGVSFWSYLRESPDVLIDSPTQLSTIAALDGEIIALPSHTPGSFRTQERGARVSLKQRMGL